MDGPEAGRSRAPRGCDPLQESVETMDVTLRDEFTRQTAPEPFERPEQSKVQYEPRLVRKVASNER